jgi:Uma2 family endonuclease
VIEVVSPGSESADRVQKVAEYAREQIPVYLIVTLDDKLYVKHIEEYRLDWSKRAYQLVVVHDGEVVLSDPFPFGVTFAELDKD